MKKNSIYPILLLLASTFLFECNNKKTEKTEVKTEITQVSNPLTPFQNHKDSIPSPQQYSGPLFKLSHDYPTSFTSPVNAPWQQALGGKPISSANALAYVDSLKSYVSSTITPFLNNFKAYDAAKQGWYHEPWTGSIREPITGSYVGSGFGGNTFTDLPGPMTTYVLTMYDKTAAYTLGKLWGKTGTKIDLKNNAGQFEQGSIIIKFAFSTSNYPAWPSMKNAQQFEIYDMNTVTGDSTWSIQNVSFFQFDIIVKDTITAPKTGWVFSTLVYDKDAPGNTVWEKMVPLGAQWGNDPNVNSTKYPNMKLTENVINPKAPKYSTETLGWGGRLSGPNDGAVIPIGQSIKTKKVYTNLAASSCMSCHSVAQDSLKAFLLPGPFPTSDSDTLQIYEPGGAEWSQYYKDREGDVPFSKGQTALDFDMVTAFKSLHFYQSATLSKEELLKVTNVKKYLMKPHRKYNGK